MSHATFFTSHGVQLCGHTLQTETYVAYKLIYIWAGGALRVGWEMRTDAQVSYSAPEVK
jgi:hypothetical protein